MKQIMEMYSWLNIAVSGIRFGPDRKAVRKELEQHIEDKTAGLMRSFPDMAEQEAGERALNSMGDAWELKASLAKVHSPWPGWLWTASRAVVWAALVLVLIAALDGGLNSARYDWQLARQARSVGRALYAEGVPDWEGERLAVYQVDARVRLGRAEVSVSEAARWREPEGECLYLRLRVAWDRPWEANQMAINSLWAEDGLGNTYEISGARSFCGGWNWCQRDLCLENVPPQAKELRIHSSLRDGLDLSVNLTREVRP